MIFAAGQYFLNADLDPQIVRGQVEAIAQAGYQAIYAQARQGLKTPYFSEKWWQVMQVIMEECRKYSIQFAIWDEDYYPSPTAGNRIIWENPAFAAQCLEFTMAEFSSADKIIEMELKKARLLKCYALPKNGNGFGEAIDISSHCGTVRTAWDFRFLAHGAYSDISKVGMPHWRAGKSHKSRTFALQWEPDTPADYLIIAVQASRADESSRHHTDILNPETTERFIEITHKEYLNRLGAEGIHACFMDEPSPFGEFPWTDSFKVEFQRQHGYDLLERVYHLAVDVDELSPLIRHHYRTTQMRLQCESYLMKIQDWSGKHNIQSAGHLTRTEWLSRTSLLWPNELRCYKYLDIPCCDPLGAGIAWPDASSYHTGIKVASSAAHLFDKPQAGSDALAVMGHETALRDLKFVIDYHLVLGINYFNLHGLSYSFDGPRKDEVPPSLFYQHSEWEYMSALTGYIRERCEQLSRGKYFSEVGVLYPSTSLYCNFKINSKNHDLEEQIHTLSEKLLSHQKDFDFIDEITLAEQIPEEWGYIILPDLSFISAESAKSLDKFTARGGKVIVLGRIPLILNDDPEAPQSKWKNPDLIITDQLNDIISQLPGPELSGSGSENIFIHRREIDGKLHCFMLNRAETPFNGIYDNQPISIPAKGSLLLDGTSKPAPVPEKTHRLSGDWRLKFPDNHIPLMIWEDEVNISVNYNLMDREIISCGEPDGCLTAISRFMYSGPVRDMKIVLDRSAIRHDCRLYINDMEISDFESGTYYDCQNLVADISDYLRSGSTPTLNILKVICRGKDSGLFEMPHLYGKFICEYRYAHRTLPFLCSHDGIFYTDALRSWQQLGYPAFSGTAEYSRQIKIETESEYHLNLGRVDDIAEVFIDGRNIALLPWEPYNCRLGMLSPGFHELRIRVTNGPGNHDRLAMLNAGLAATPIMYQTITPPLEKKKGVRIKDTSVFSQAEDKLLHPVG